MHEGTVRGAVSALRRLTAAYRANKISSDEARAAARPLAWALMQSHTPTWRKRKIKAQRRAANKVARRQRRINRVRAR